MDFGKAITVLLTVFLCTIEIAAEENLVQPKEVQGYNLSQILSNSKEILSSAIKKNLCASLKRASKNSSRSYYSQKYDIARIDFNNQCQKKKMAKLAKPNEN